MMEQVHCWCVDVAASDGRWVEMLSAEERERAARFRFAADRRRFEVAHGALRDVLGRYLDADPRELRFVTGAFGKPELSAEWSGRLNFSLSHSDKLALIAIAADTMVGVGVDVEYIRPRPRSEYAEIARCFFSSGELAQLATVPERDYARSFFRIWTRKEAYVKAHGADLATALENHEALPADGSVFSFEPAPGYMAAVAVAENKEPALRFLVHPGQPMHDVQRQLAIVVAGDVHSDEA